MCVCIGHEAGALKSDQAAGVAPAIVTVGCGEQRSQASGLEECGGRATLIGRLPYHVYPCIIVRALAGHPGAWAARAHHDTVGWIACWAQ